MRKKKASKLTAIAYSGLAVAVLSAFTTIVGYTNSSDVHRSFSLIDFLLDAEGFGSFVFNEYMGKAYVHYEPWQLFVLIALGAAAIVCSFVGLKRLSKQTDNQTSFVLTIMGLIGTMAPSVIILSALLRLRGIIWVRLSVVFIPLYLPLQ